MRQSLTPKVPFVSTCTARGCDKTLLLNALGMRTGLSGHSTKIVMSEQNTSTLHITIYTKLVLNVREQFKVLTECITSKSITIMNLTENSVEAKSGGCFHGSSIVMLADGKSKPLKELQVGDKVLATDQQGNLVTSDFLMFLDQDQQIKREFHVLQTDEPHRRLTLTPAHLVFVVDSSNTNSSSIRAVFASNVHLGQWLVAVGIDQTDHLIPARVTKIYVDHYEGSYAPVTSHGTIVVDGVLASCYAVVEDHDLAHWVFAPVRLWHSFLSLVGMLKGLNSMHQADGVHWYPELLYHVGGWLLDRSCFHPQS